MRYNIYLNDCFFSEIEAAILIKKEEQNIVSFYPLKGVECCVGVRWDLLLFWTCWNNSLQTYHVSWTDPVFSTDMDDWRLPLFTKQLHSSFKVDNETKANWQCELWKWLYYLCECCVTLYICVIYTLRILSLYLFCK